MLKRVRLSSFKSVGRAVDVELGNLTLVAGANSSGKSTLLQSILLMHQTMSSKVTGRAVVLNGPTVRLGSFEDVLAHGSRTPVFSVGFDISPDSGPSTGERGTQPPGGTSARRAAHRRLTAVSLDVSFKGRRRRRTPQQDASEQLISVSSTELSSEYMDGEGTVRRSRLKVRPSTERQLAQVTDLVGSGLVKHLRAQLTFRPYLDPASRAAIKATSPTAEPVGVFVDHFLPRSLAVQVNVTMEGISKSVETVLQFGSRNVRGPEGRVPFPRPFMAALRDSLPESMASRLLNEDEQKLNIGVWSERFGRLPAKDRSQALALLRSNAKTLIESAYSTDESREWEVNEHDIRFEHLPFGLNEGAEQVDAFLSKSVRYLGPLRDEPRPVYPLSSSGDIVDVGTKGEFTASVLDLNRDTMVTYLSPANVEAGKYDAPLETKPLLTAVEEWLQYMGVSEGVSTREMGSRGHELRVRTGAAQSLDLTQVGVGVSQILPIIVLGLVAPARSLTIFEQPELHLHPRVQTRLGDFFVSMIYSDLQCLVETHSEYLINRLRLRTASAESDLHQRVKMYFVEQEESESRYREVEISEFGAIVDWPAGFFDEAQQEAEAILRAGLAKRRTRKGRVSAPRHD